MASVEQLCEDGQKVENLNMKSPQEDITAFYSKKLNEQNDEKLSTPGSPAQNKKKISIDKLNTWKEDLIATKLYEILEEERTLKERDYSHFWNQSVAEKSKQLQSIPKIGLRDLEENSLSLSVVSSIPQSSMWSEKKKDLAKQKNFQKIYSQSSLILPQNTTVAESMTATRKVRIYPSDDLKAHLEYYFGATRYVYNKAIEEINRLSKIYYEARKPLLEELETLDKKEERYKELKATLKNIKTNISTSGIRSKAVTTNAKIEKDSKEEWLLNVQYLSRIDASDEALKNYKTAVTNIQRGNIKHFDLKFRSKKNPKQTAYISYKAIDIENQVLFPSFQKKDKNMSFKVKRKGKKDYEKYKKFKPRDMKISVDNNHYYLHLVIDKPSAIKTMPKMKKVVALDPGGNTFQNGYSPQNRFYKFGEKIVDTIRKKYLNKIDKLQSKLSEKPNKKIQSTLNSLRTKVKNKVDDLHKQTAAYLFNRYETVIVGDLNLGGSAIRKKDRKIPKTVTRALNVLAHGKFRDYLKYRASTVNNRRVIIQNEAWTSKTCGYCGHIHKDLGSAKIFKCPSCDYVADRDLNGARNIFLRSI
jgi:putative transposase